MHHELPKEFHYKVRWRTSGQRQGFHASSNQGSGQEFVGHASLFNHGDPRRIDVRASIYDLHGDWRVRLHRTRAALPMFVLLDLSASMGFEGRRRKLDVISQFVASAGYSARRTGDAFGLIAANDQLCEALWLPPTFNRSAVFSILETLAKTAPTGQSEGLIEALGWLPRARSLVFLVSDFHWPQALLDRLLGGLVHHHVVPVVMWDAAELAPPTRFGLYELSDPETGRQRTVLMRRSLWQRWRQRIDEHRARLIDHFHHHDLRPFIVDADFDADAMTRYFLGEDHHGD